MASGSAMLGKHPDLSRAQVCLFAFTLGCAAGVDFVASAMMGVAGTHIRGGIHASPEDFLWSLTSYAAAATVANLVLRRIAQDISYRGYTLLGLAIATVGAALCAVCNTPLELSLARAVQGLGAGGLFTASRIIIQLAAAREERRPLFLGFISGGMGLAALAPWISAVLVEDASWRMIFVVQAGMSAAAMLLVLASYRPGQPLAPVRRGIGAHATGGPDHPVRPARRRRCRYAGTLVGTDRPAGAVDCGEQSLRAASLRLRWRGPGRRGAAVAAVNRVNGYTATAAPWPLKSKLVRTFSQA